MNWFVMKGAKNREAAEQLIRHMLSPEVMREMFKISTGYVYPAYEWGWDDSVIKESTYAQHVTDAWRKKAQDPSGYTAGEWPGPPTPWTASLESSNFWTDMFGEVLGGRSVEDALKGGHDRAVRVFKEFGAKGE
jgi:ABC-type glycerol-3-phosphate transport system substrate-binding protein